MTWQPGLFRAGRARGAVCLQGETRAEASAGGRMDLGTPDSLDLWLEPPEDVFSTASVQELGFPCPALEVPATRLQEQGLQGWESSGGCVPGLQDKEPEDFLQLLINPNEVYCSETPPGSDGSISEDPGHPRSPSAPTAPSAPALYEVVYQAGPLDRLQGKAGPAVGFISIQLDQWSPAFTVPDAGLASGLPLDAQARALPRAGAIATGPPATLLPYQTLFLTEEEKRLLAQEGLSLPAHLPLTKAEERLLKKVRRKIRNKQSAQDSRRRKKEYIDGLEGRVAACSAQNQELQRKVQELERHNTSLVTQLRQLQLLIAQTSNKAAQTSTCVLILLFSLALVVLPSLSPFQGLPEAGPEDYRPHGVISRNILTHKAVTESLDVPAERSPGPSRINGSRTLLEMGGEVSPRGHGRGMLHTDEM